METRSESTRRPESPPPPSQSATVPMKSSAPGGLFGKPAMASNLPRQPRGRKIDLWPLDHYDEGEEIWYLAMRCVLNMQPNSKNLEISSRIMELIEEKRDKMQEEDDNFWEAHK